MWQATPGTTGNREAPVAQPRYQAIDDYGVIGDCRTAALVARDGGIHWWCLPHFSGGALFAALLDADQGGHFTIRPTAPFQVSRRYLPHTPILETTFRTSEGVLRLVDCMPVLEGGNNGPQPQPERELLRRVEGLSGDVELEVLFDPRPDFGRKKFQLESLGRLGWCCRFGAEAVFLTTPVALQRQDPGAGGRFRLRAGESQRFVLSYVRQDIATLVPPAEVDARVEETARWWRQWCARCTYDGPYRETVQRSLMTLKLMTYSLSGAVVAASTAALPETLGGVRNWDYRFCWLRDAALTLRAFTDLGHVDEGAHFIDWLLHATRLTQPRLQVMYDIHGETDLTERTLGHLEGYRGSAPVRIGNGACDQLQLDVYGSVVLAVWLHIDRGGELDAREQQLLAGFGNVVCDSWRQADQGIWELRGAARQHTFSKFMCWVALDCLLALHQQGRLHVDVSRFQRERAAIRAVIEGQAFDPRVNSYVDVLGGREADASLLLMGCFGYQPADHPRMTGTFDFIDRQLGRGPLVYRYRPGSDGLPGDEGAFGICGFWAVDLLARAGRIHEARARFEHLLAYANDLGLFAEEIDPRSGAALGNFPQAFTHVGLINAAQSLREHGGS